MSLSPLIHILFYICDYMSVMCREEHPRNIQFLTRGGHLWLRGHPKGCCLATFHVLCVAELKWLGRFTAPYSFGFWMLWRYSHSEIYVRECVVSFLLFDLLTKILYIVGLRKSFNSFFLQFQKFYLILCGLRFGNGNFFSKPSDM